LLGVLLLGLLVIAAGFLIVALEWLYRVGAGGWWP